MINKTLVTVAVVVFLIIFGLLALIDWTEVSPNVATSPPNINSDVPVTVEEVTAILNKRVGLKIALFDGEITITGYAGNSTNVSIPSTTNGYPVTCIGNEAFRVAAI